MMAKDFNSTLDEGFNDALKKIAIQSMGIERYLAAEIVMADSYLEHVEEEYGVEVQNGGLGA
jgi:hypothetical protein